MKSIMMLALDKKKMQAPEDDKKDSDLAPKGDSVPGDEPTAPAEAPTEVEMGDDDAGEPESSDPKLDALMDLMQTLKSRPELIDPMKAMIDSMSDEDGSKQKSFDEDMVADTPQSDQDYMDEGGKPRSIGERAKMDAIKRLKK